MKKSELELIVPRRAVVERLCSPTLKLRKVYLPIPMIRNNRMAKGLSIPIVRNNRVVKGLSIPIVQAIGVVKGISIPIDPNNRCGQRYIDTYR